MEVLVHVAEVGVYGPSRDRCRWRDRQAPALCE